MTDHLAELFDQQPLACRAVLGLGVKQSGIGGATNPVGEVAQGVTDHDQRTTRGQPSACFREDVVLDVKVGQQHQVEGGTVRWLPRPYVGDDPCLLYTSPSPRDGLLS